MDSNSFSKLCIVVAHYNSTSFIDFISLFNNLDVYIYSKAAKSSLDFIQLTKALESYPLSHQVRLRSLENVGREGETYLSHIINQAESEYTLFIQDDIENHVVNYIDAKKQIDRAIEKLIDFYALPCSWRKRGPIINRTIINGQLHLDHLPDSNGIKNEAKNLGVKLPSIYLTQTCAHFLLSRIGIRRHSKAFYTKLRKWLLVSDSNGYYLEHMWVLIFSSSRFGLFIDWIYYQAGNFYKKLLKRVT